MLNVSVSQAFQLVVAEQKLNLNDRTDLTMRTAAVVIRRLSEILEGAW